MQPNRQESKNLIGQICEYKEGPIHAIVKIVSQQTRGEYVDARLEVLAHSHRMPIPALDVGAEFSVGWNLSSGWNQVFLMKLLKAYNVDDAVDIVNSTHRRKRTWITHNGSRT